MKRHAFEQLEAWKKSPHRRPLVLMGARQVGKTWLMQEFGRTAYRRVAYISFDTNEDMRRRFERDLDVQRLLTAIQLEAGFPLDAEDTLIIFDEVQECPRALTSLKYFCEFAPQYHIMAAGSLLGVSAHEGTGWPVGKIDTLPVYPMSFTEFLDATGNGQLHEAIARRDWPLLTDFASRAEDLLRHYYYVGGMPAVVARFAENNDFTEVREAQLGLLDDYRRDFTKHAPAVETPRLSLVWNSIPVQLARENKRFSGNAVQQGMRMARLEVALQWLVDSGLVYRVPRVSKPALPLAGYQETAFKAYVLDVGLLSAQCGLAPKTLLEKNRVFTEFKGALTEQYVQQQLRAEFGTAPYYWSAGANRAEVDFLFEQDGATVPLEVKAETNLRSKSLLSYVQRFSPPVSVRCSMAPYSRQPLRDGSTLLNIPLFGVSALRAECADTLVP